MTLICEDPYDVDDFVLPDVRVWSEEDGLVPRPPQGWFIGFTLPSVEYRRSLDAAIWVELLLSAQEQSRQAGFRRHRIARNANGDAVLLVHPDLTNWLADEIDTIDGMIQGGCNCGGWECIEPVKNFQDRFNEVLAHRRWPTLTHAERQEALNEVDSDLPDYTLAAAIAAPTFPKNILGEGAATAAFYVVHHY